MLPGVDATSPKTQELVDSGGPPHRRAVLRAGARRCWSSTASRLDALAGLLLEQETLDEPDIYAVVGFPRPLARPSAPVSG